MWVDLIQSFEGLSSKDWGFLRRNSISRINIRPCLSFYPSDFRLKLTASTLLWVSSLPACSTNFRLAKLTNAWATSLKSVSLSLLSLHSQYILSLSTYGEREPYIPSWFCCFIYRYHNLKDYSLSRFFLMFCILKLCKICTWTIQLSLRFIIFSICVYIIFSKVLESKWQTPK